MNFVLKELQLFRRTGRTTAKNVRVEIDEKTGIISFTPPRGEKTTYSIDQFVKKKLPVTSRTITLVFDIKHPSYHKLQGRPNSLKLVTAEEFDVHEALRASFVESWKNIEKAKIAANNNPKYPIMNIPVEEVVWLKERVFRGKNKTWLKIDRNKSTISTLNEMDKLVEYHISQFEIREFAPTGTWVALVFNKKHHLYSSMSFKAEVLKFNLGDDEKAYKDVVNAIKLMMDELRGEASSSSDDVVVVDFNEPSSSHDSDSDSSDGVVIGYMPTYESQFWFPIVHWPISYPGRVTRLMTLDGHRAIGVTSSPGTPPYRNSVDVTEPKSINSDAKYPLLEISVEEVVWLKETEVHRKNNVKVKIDRNSAHITISDENGSVVEYHIGQFEMREFAPNGTWLALVFDKKHPSYSGLPHEAEVLKMKIGDDENVYKDVVTVLHYMMKQNKIDKDGYM